MPKKWYVHLQGETFGPLSTDLVKLLLRQNRLQFTDFLWTDGLKRWERILEIKDFEAQLPPYPHVAPPNVDLSRPETVDVTGKLKPVPGKIKTKAVETPAVVEPAAAVTAPKAAMATAAPSKLTVPLPIRGAERVAIDGKVVLDGRGTFSVMNISETGLILKSSKGIPIGIEVKFSLESTTLGKPLAMTGITIREGVYAGENGVAIEFTRVNPAHKRLLQDYVKSTQSAKAA